MVALPNTNHAQGQFAADRLRRLISAMPFSLGPDLPSLTVTMSVGVAIDGLSKLDQYAIDKMCHRADAALYEAKSAERDTVAICGANAA